MPAAAVLGLAVLLLAARVLCTGLAGTPLVSAAEASFAVRAYALHRFGFDAAGLAWHDGGIAALQVAGYGTVSDAVGRAGDAVTAARESMVVAALIAAAALGVTAHRLRLSVPSTVAVVALFALTPAGVLLHRTVEPANLGVLWICVALALAAAGTGRAGAAIGSVCYLALAVLTAPAVLVALVPVCTVLVATGEIGRLPRPWRYAAGGAGLAGWAALAALAAAGRLTPVDVDVPLPALTALDAALFGLAAAGGLAALRVRWLRPLGVGLLATGATAAVAEPARTPLVVLALPLAALLLPALAEHAWERGRQRWTGRVRSAGRPAPGRRRLTAAAAPVAVLGLVAALAWAPGSAADRDAPAGPGPTEQARDWLLANLPSRPRLAVDAELWFALVRSGYPADQLTAASGVGPPSSRPPQAWADLAFAAGRDSALLGPDADRRCRQARQNSLPVARFGGGAAEVQVRRVVRAGTRAEVARDAAARIDAGRALAGNPRLQLAPAAAAVLTAGGVDARLLTVLVAATDRHRLGIAGFPVVPGEDAQTPRRLVAIAALDGRAVRPGSPAVGALEQWLRAQQPPFRPAATALTPAPGSTGTTGNTGNTGTTVLLVRYDAAASIALPPLPPP